MRRAASVLLAIACGRCASGPAQPVPLRLDADTCASCRMTISDARFAAELLAPGEEPKLFDDLGCLRDYLASGAAIPEGAIAYVADHRTRAWLRADGAVYARIDGLATPMASGLAAWTDEGSRATDPSAPQGPSRSAGQVLGALP